MASKAETRSAIVSLAKELDVTIPDVEQIDKLEPLEALLKELQDKKAGPPQAAATGLSPVAPPVAPPVVGAPPPVPTLARPQEKNKKIVATTYVVSEGKSVTTKRGDIGALEHVWPADFGGGQLDLDHWVVNGFVTKTDHFAE